MEQPKFESVETIKLNESLHLNKENMNLLLSVKPPNYIPENVQSVVESKMLSEKTEFHITIMGKEVGNKILSILQPLSEEERNKLILKIEKLSQEFTWAYNLLEEYYFISKISAPDDIRSSVIQTINLPDLELYYKKLNELLGDNFVIPFPHITLFTTSTKEENKLRGIGIYSKEQMSSLSPIKL